MLAMFGWVRGDGHVQYSNNNIAFDLSALCFKPLQLYSGARPSALNKLGAARPLNLLYPCKMLY